MATYAEVINDNGIVSVDDTVARLAKTRTITLTGGYSTLQDSYFYFFDKNQYLVNGYSVFTINLTENEQFVSVRALNGGHSNVIVSGEFVDAKTYKLYLCGNYQDPNTYASDYVVDIYGTELQTNSEKCGLQLFNETGDKIFDSNYYYMDVINFYNLNFNGILVNGHYAANFNEIQATVDIGNFDVANHAVAINGCPSFIVHDLNAYDYAVCFFGVCFTNNQIYLEKRGCRYDAELNGTVKCSDMGFAASGIILNTQNIS